MRVPLFLSVGPFLLVFASSAWAATPVAVHVRAELPAVPPRLAVYAVDDATFVPFDTLTSVLGVEGEPETVPLAPGALHVSDDSVHLFYYPDGSAVFNDTLRDSTEEPMQPLAKDWLFEDADSLLAQLGFTDTGPVTIRADRIGHHDIEIFGANNERLGGWIAHQAAIFGQDIDGLPGFGPGAEVEVVYAEGGDIVAFSHAIRSLDISAWLPSVSPHSALQTFTARVNHGERWNLLRLRSGRVDNVTVSGIQLGYFLPGVGVDTEFVVPVYEIHGNSHGVTVDGEELTSEFVWYEPAVAGYGVPQLKLPPVPSSR